MTALHQYTAKRGPVRVWTCDICGERFEWADKPGAKWYGSWKDADAARWDRIIVVCSAECKKRALAKAIGNSGATET
jgi:hypothetical protein